MRGHRRLEPDPLICNRALAAWLLSEELIGTSLSGGRRPAAHVCRHGGCRYAVVASTSTGVLAVYRIDPDGTLARLDRWPDEIENRFRPAATPAWASLS